MEKAWENETSLEVLTILWATQRSWGTGSHACKPHMCCYVEHWFLPDITAYEKLYIRSKQCSMLLEKLDWNIKFQSLAVGRPQYHFSSVLLHVFPVVSYVIFLTARIYSVLPYKRSYTVVFYMTHPWRTLYPVFMSNDSFSTVLLLERWLASIKLLCNDSICRSIV